MKKFARFLFLLVFLLISAFLLFNYIQEPTPLRDATRKSVGGQYIKLSKGYVHYEIKGNENHPLLILIGGGGLGYSVWDNNIGFLIKNGFKVLRYDHYGRGYSDRVNESYSLDLFYNQFVELLDSLNLEKPLNLAGLSMGGMVAMKYSHQFPQNVNKLVLIDPAGVNPFRAPFVLKTPILSDLLMTFYWRPKAIQKQIEEFYEPGRFPEYRTKLEKEIKIKGYKKVQHSIWLNTLSVDLSEVVKALGKQDTPIMLIWGKQDPRTLFETSNVYIASIPNLKFLPVDKAGHLSNYERPDIINPALAEFLKR